MEKIIIIFLIVFASLSSFAQDPQLLETLWYLQKVTIEDVDYFPPNVINEQENGTIYFFEEFDVVNIDYCDFADALVNYDTNENIFTLDDSPGILLGDCLSPENITFSLIYSSVFFNQSIAINPFNYNIVSDSDNFMLSIENNNGDKAIFSNVLLSNQDFNILDFTIFPNPVTNILIIKNSGQYSINRIKVFDVLGKLVLQENNPTNQLDISILSSGLLFVKIETDKGIFVEKIVKE